MIEIYINDSLTDLPESDLDFGIDYTALDVSKIGERGSARSYSIALPPTNRNKTIFESSEQVPNLTNLPYQIIKARVLVDGVDVMVRFCELESINKDGFNIRLYGLSADFFTPLADLFLYDIDFSDLDHVFEKAVVAATRTNDTGIIYAIIDFHSDSPNAYIDNVLHRIDVRYLPPSIYVNTILDKIFADTEYELINDVEEDSAPVVMPLPYNGVELQSDFLNEKYNAVFGITDPLEIQPFQSGNFNFDTISGYAGVYYDLPYTAPFTTKRAIRIEDRIYSEVAVSLDVTYTDPTNVTLINFSIYDENGIPQNSAFFTFNNQPVGTNTITATMDLLFVKYPYQRPKYLTVNIYNNQFGNDPITVENTSTVTFSNTRQFSAILQYSEFLSVTALMPQMTQAEFLKNYIKLFGLIPIVDYLNKKVYFKKFSVVKSNIGRAYDWSSKVDKSDEPEQRFLLSDYAQNNFFKWRHDGDEAIPDGADGVIEIANKNLPIEKNIVELSLASSATVERFDGFFIPNIPAYTAATLSQTLTPRWLVVSRVDRAEFGGIDLSYYDGSGAILVDLDIPLCYFIDKSKEFNLGFGVNMIRDYYSDMQEIIQRVKLLTIYIRLNAADINQLDFTIPVYLSQYESYFYINKIQGYAPAANESCIVELVKLNL